MKDIAALLGACSNPLLGVPLGASLRASVDRLPLFKPEHGGVGQAGATDCRQILKQCERSVALVDLQLVKELPSTRRAPEPLVATSRALHDSGHPKLLDPALHCGRLRDNDVSIDEPASWPQEIEGLAKHGVLLGSVEMMQCIGREGDVHLGYVIDQLA